MESLTKPTSFEDYRQRIEEILALAEASIPVAPPADTVALDNARIRMARTLTAYHLFAERELFTPCLYALRDPGHKAQVRTVASECAALAADFRAWAREWQEYSARDHWAVYRPRSVAIITRVRRHIAAAQAEVRRCETLGIATKLCRRAA